MKVKDLNWTPDKYGNNGQTYGGLSLLFKKEAQIHAIVALQSHQISAKSQASPETNKNHKIPCPEAPFPNRLIKGERNGGSRVVTIFLNSNDHLTFDSTIGKIESGV